MRRKCNEKQRNPRKIRFWPAGKARRAEFLRQRKPGRRAAGGFGAKSWRTYKRRGPRPSLYFSRPRQNSQMRVRGEAGATSFRRPRQAARGERFRGSGAVRSLRSSLRPRPSPKLACATGASPNRQKIPLLVFCPKARSGFSALRSAKFRFGPPFGTDRLTLPHRPPRERFSSGFCPLAPAERPESLRRKGL